MEAPASCEPMYFEVGEPVAWIRKTVSWEFSTIDLTQGGEAVSRVAHNHEIAGAIPVPATNHFNLDSEVEPDGDDERDTRGH